MCPNCGTDCVFSCPIAHSQGTRSTVIYDQYHQTSRNEVEYTELAKRAAPPNDMKGLGCVTAIIAFVFAIVVFWGANNNIIKPHQEFLFGLSVTYLTWGLFVGVPLVTLITTEIYIALVHGSEYRRRLVIWNRSWICGRCGHRWLPTEVEGGISAENPYRFAKGPLIVSMGLFVALVGIPSAIKVFGPSEQELAIKQTRQKPYNGPTLGH